MARKLVFDRVLFAAVTMLTLLGLVMVYSSTSGMVTDGSVLGNKLFRMQVIAAALGAVGMVLAMHLDYRLLKRRPVLYGAAAIVVSLLVIALFGAELNNSRRWVRLFGLSIQPSELAKLLAIVYVAYQIDRKSDRIDTHAFLLPTFGFVGFLSALILAGKDLGTTVVLLAPIAVMAFLAGLSLRWLLGAAAVGLPMVIAAIAVQPYRQKRLLSFLHPEAEPLGDGFQLLQSLIAVGSGGLLGLGPGQSVQKLHFLPSPHADFVFSIVAEELGFLGATLFVGLFGVVLWRGVEAGRAAPDLFGRALAWGMTSLLVGQALIHMSVALGLLPTTGVPLPFISHGGSSMVTSLLAAGLLLNVSQHGGA